MWDSQPVEFIWPSLIQTCKYNSNKDANPDVVEYDTVVYAQT